LSFVTEGNDLICGLASNSKDNEVFSWYRHPNKPDQELAIWGVGGYSNIQLKLKYITESIQSQPEKQFQNRFNKIVYLSIMI